MASYLKAFLVKMRYPFYACLFAVMLTVFLLPYYVKGTLILGGEGNFVLNFKALLDNFNFAWVNMATGVPATSLNFNYFNTFFFVLLQDLSLPSSLINFILIFLLYFLPYIALLLISYELKMEPLISFFISVFYIINPFSSYFLTSLNQWNSLILFVMPFSFYLILKYYCDNIKLFLCLGLFSFIFSFTNANPPLMVIYQLSLFISLVFIQLHRGTSFNIFLFLKKYFVIFSSFVLFNAWWIFNWIQVLSSDMSKMYTADFAVQYARELVKAYPFLFFRIFSLTSLISASNITNYFAEFYNTTFSYFVALIPLIILWYYLYRHFPAKLSLRFLVSIILLVIFLSKGPSGIFGFLYDFALLRLPLFSVFKTPPEKWGVLFVFFFSLLLLLVFHALKNDKNYKLILYSFFVYLIFCGIPFATGRFIPDYKMNDGNRCSRKFVDKKEYREVRESLSSDLATYRILSLPGSLNYQVSILMYDDKHYTGMDPLLYNINKQFIAAYSTNYLSNFDVLFDNLSLPNFSRLTSIFNIGKIIVNKDMEPWFAFKEKESFSDMDVIFGKNMVKTGNPHLNIYTPSNYLPRFYTASSISLICGQTETLAPMTETRILDQDPALLFTDQKSSSVIYNDLVSSNHQVNHLVLTDDQSCKKEKSLHFWEAVSEARNATYIFRNPSGVFHVLTPGYYSLKAILKEKNTKELISDKILFSQNIIEIDGKFLNYGNFKNKQKGLNAKKIVLTTEISIKKGSHEFKTFQNPFYDIQWVIFEPATPVLSFPEKPQITFKRISPSKYLLKVKKASAPFWLIFGDTFHKKWKLYQGPFGERHDLTLMDIIAQYRDMKISESMPLAKFSPEDINYLFAGPLKAGHYQINGYANGWYIDPEKLGLGENFNLTVFFWPQSLFYLGMGISALAFMGGLIVLGIRSFRIKHDE